MEESTWTSGLDVGQLYHVTSCSRLDSFSTGQAILYIHDTTGANSAVNGPTSPSNTAWQMYDSNFAATGTSKIRIHLAETITGQGVYWDNVQLTPGWLEDFELGSLAPWSIWGSVMPMLSPIANSGIFSLAETNCSSGWGVYQDIGGVVPGYSYRVTARTSASSGATASAMLYVHDSLRVNSVAQVSQPPAGLWSESGVNFLATTSGNVRVHLGCVSGSGTIYWDDLLIYKMSAGN